MGHYTASMKRVKGIAERMEGRMGWTKELPTEEGWYWLRYEGNPRPSVCHVVSCDDGDGKGERLWVEIDEDSKMPVAAYGDEYTWQGPITPEP